MGIIGLIIAGLIIGLLGKFVAPSTRDNTPLWLTLLCGIGGVLIGYWVAGALGVADTTAWTGSAGSSPSWSQRCWWSRPPRSPAGTTAPSADPVPGGPASSELDRVPRGQPAVRRGRTRPPLAQQPADDGQAGVVEQPVVHGVRLVGVAPPARSR